MDFKQYLIWICPIRCQIIRIWDYSDRIRVLTSHSATTEVSHQGPTRLLKLIGLGFGQTVKTESFLSDDFIKKCTVKLNVYGLKMKEKEVESELYW